MILTKSQVINPPPPHAAVGADDANDYEDANDIENNAAEEDEIEGGKVVSVN